jgi:hypothetical protein
LYILVGIHDTVNMKNTNSNLEKGRGGGNNLR